MGLPHKKVRSGVLSRTASAIEKPQKNSTQERLPGFNNQSSFKQSFEDGRKLGYSFLAFAAALPTHMVAMTAMIVTMTA